MTHSLFHLIENGLVRQLEYMRLMSEVTYLAGIHLSADYQPLFDAHGVLHFNKTVREISALHVPFSFVHLHGYQAKSIYPP